MAGNKGELTRSKGGKQQTDYPSDKFGILPEGRTYISHFFKT